MTGRCTRWESWLPGSGGRVKVLNWNLHSFQLLKIIQVLDSISWVFLQGFIIVAIGIKV